jgi:MFS family permease
MMASLATKYYQLLLSQGVCSAIGVAAIFQPAMGCIPGWFSRRRGAAYGIISTGSGIGGVVFPIMVSRLMGRVGYAWTMRIGAFVILVLLGIANLTVRARGTRTGKKMCREGLVKPFREAKMVLLVLGFMCLTFGVFIPINYIVVQAVDAGMSAALAQYLVAILNAGSLLGRLSAGLCSDRVGAYNIFVCVVFLAGVVVLGLWIPAAGNAAIIVFAVVFGFTTGAYVSLAPALVVGISPLEEIGYRTGLMFLFASVGGLTTSPIGGAILQRDGGSYTGMKAFSGVMLLVGTGFVVAARVVKTGWVLKAKF